MKKEESNSAKELTKQRRKAVRLLRKARRIHQMEQQGRIEKGVAVDRVIRLNNQASAEIDKFIEAQTAFISEQEKLKKQIAVEDDSSE